MRVDLFGVREGGAIDGKLHAPLRPEVPTLKPGKEYLLEAVVRTLKLGHPFTQGTVDSNEVWVEVTAKSGDRVIGRSGGIDAASGNEVDRWAHFVNVFMLDRDGQPHQSPQSAGHFHAALQPSDSAGSGGQPALRLAACPRTCTAPVTVEVKLQYRKFDKEYMEFVAKNGNVGGEKIRGDNGRRRRM